MPRKGELTKANMAMILIGIVATALVAGIAYLAYTGAFSTSIIMPPEQTQFSMSLPIIVAVTDKWAGGSIAAPACIIYKYSTIEEYETVTIAAGVGLSAKRYKTGERYWVFLSSGAAAARHYYDWTVPYAESADAASHSLPLDFFTIGTYAFTVAKPTGTTMVTASNLAAGIWNVTNAIYDYPTFTIMMRNTLTTDSGVMDSYDPTKNPPIDRKTFVYLRINGTGSESIIVKNIPQILTVTTSERYFGMELNAADLVRDTLPDGTYKSEGIKTFSLQLDASGYTTVHTTANATVRLTLSTWTSMNYFKTYYTEPSDRIALIASFTFHITNMDHPDSAGNYAHLV